MYDFNIYTYIYAMNTTKFSEFCVKKEIINIKFKTMIILTEKAQLFRNAQFFLDMVTEITNVS